MARKVDLAALRTRSADSVSKAQSRYDDAVAADLDYLLLRWIAQMTAVEVHAVWERYVENRLVAALNHNAAHFLHENDIKGVTRVTSGLAFYVVRGGGRFFDFRSSSELIDKADRVLGKPDNPFRTLSAHDRSYIDALAAIRNCIVHRSDAAGAAYRRALKSVYSVKSAPEPDEFLHAKDYRRTSPARYRSRLQGLTTIVLHAINHT
ncbi:MAG: hypothetical protein HYX97_00150 [Chloroflexi bacterium]|nr:hypothetical protein [Chloroflexota bacterium]